MSYCCYVSRALEQTPVCFLSGHTYLRMLQEESRCELPAREPAPSTLQLLSAGSRAGREMCSDQQAVAEAPCSQTLQPLLWCSQGTAMGMECPIWPTAGRGPADPPSLWAQQPPAVRPGRGGRLTTNRHNAALGNNGNAVSRRG